MQEPFDWEKAMETTRRSAAAASQNSENSVAGMAKLLREIDRHSISQGKLTKAVQELEARQSKQLAAIQARLNSAQGDSRPFWRLPLLGLLAVFVVGVVFGGFIVS